MGNISVNLIIGNIISLVAAFFTAKSSWSKDRWHIYFYQVLQCFFLAVASVFFNSYTGILTLFICSFRNYMAAIDKLDKKVMILCIVLVTIPGILINNRGILGWIILFANFTYTLGMYYAKREISIKLNIIFNLSLWIIYEICILDIPSVIADAIALIVAVLAVLRYTNKLR